MDCESLRAMAPGPTSQYKKTFFIFSANLSITILGLTNTGIFELELAVLEQLPMWRRVCCEIHVFFFLLFYFYFFLLQKCYFCSEVFVQKYTVFSNISEIITDSVLLSGC